MPISTIETHIVKQLSSEEIPEILDILEATDVERMNGEGKFSASLFDKDSHKSNLVFFNLYGNGKYLAMSSCLLRENFSAAPGFEFSLAVVNAWNDRHFGAVSTAYLESDGDMVVLRQIMPVGLGIPLPYLITSTVLFNQAISHFQVFMAENH